MSIVVASLMCHAPIVVPPVGAERAGACARTTAAMREVARAIVAHTPDVLVIVSPHTPRRRHAWGVCEDERIAGDFARFGHPESRLSFRGAPKAARSLAAAARASGLEVAPVQGDDLDHGAAVPLWFVAEAGYAGRVVLVALPYPGAENETTFGAAVAEAARASGGRWAVLASGDMSHRLEPGAPAGFDPRARDFDATFVAHVRAGRLDLAIQPDAELRDLAGEDVVQSAAVAFGSIGGATRGLDVHAYEAPFGVGYLEAILYSAEATADDRAGAPPTDAARLLAVARDAIEHALEGRRYAVPTLPAPRDVPRAVFVTLRSANGDLRGCIGRTEPSFPTLAEEVADCAVSAAVRDPRFAPVERAELDSLDLEISVLEPPEPVESRSRLDPRTYGVVVASGRKRGVLLPDLDGVDTVDQQLAIAARKAGISPNEPYRIARFRVEKLREPRR